MARRIARFMGVVLLVLAIGVVAVAAPPEGRGNGKHQVLECQVGDDFVTVDGLTTDDVVNFWMTKSDGTTEGWVLGYGTSWSVWVPDPDMHTTYQFISRTRGKDGAKYDVFAECSTSS